VTSTHSRGLTPSPLLALVCLAIVHRLRPSWIAVTLTEAAREEEVSPERLSRLCTRAIASFTAVLDTLTRRGRPPGDESAGRDREERAILSALLDVATAVLSQVSLRRPGVQEILVGAWLRLAPVHPRLTLRRFCETLGVSERTFRDWRKRALRPTVEPEPVEAPRKRRRARRRSPRRPRFEYGATLPGTQQAADTTDLKAFGQRLKLMAVQDVGGRDQDLFSSVIIDDHESAERIAEAFGEAIGVEGMQAMTDQGTPFMAQALRDALEALGADHAPQKEGDPTAKAPIERAFGTVKTIARPLFDLTNHLAVLFPQLACVEIAKPATELVVTMLLRAYQAGARAARRAIQDRGAIDPDELACLAAENRERARAEDRSARLLLTQLHDAFQIEGPVDQFIRTFRTFPLSVLKAARRDLAGQIQRSDIRNRCAYFSAIVHRHAEAHQRAAAEKRHWDREARRRHQEAEERGRRQKARLANPRAWLREALELLACQWQPEHARLLFGGVGLGRGELRRALPAMIDRHGLAAGLDMARGVYQAFANAFRPQLGQDGLAAISRVFEDALQLAGEATPEATEDCSSRFASAILGRDGPSPRSGPSAGLRTLAAERGGS